MDQKQTLGDLIADDSFMSWLKGEGTPEINKYWDEWLRGSPEHEKLVQEALELRDFIHHKKANVPNKKDELVKLHNAIDHFEKGRNNFNLNLSNKSRRLFSWRAIAAGFLILITSIGVYYKLSHQPKSNKAEAGLAGRTKVYHTDFGERLTVKLSDETLIVLNAHSNLKITLPGKSKTVNNNNIDVWLNGEAYFKVPHYEGNHKRILTIHTQDGLIRDIGTEFNVSTFGPGTEAVLEKGEIEVQLQKDAENSSDIKLKPGERVRFFAKSGNMKRENVHPEVYTSWINHKWIFEDTPLTQIAQRIEQTFGLKVVIRDPKIKNKKLSGSIKSTDLEIIKKALIKILHIPIQQRGNTLYLGDD